MIPTFHETQIRSVMNARLAVDTIRQAFRADGEGLTTVPPVINLALPRGEGEFHVKTAYIDGVSHVAVKVASGFFGNAAKGLPTGSGLMALFHATTGLPCALLFDNGFLTDLRTGAAGAVAAEYLARREIDVVGVIGSGIQGRFQIDCLREVRQFQRVIAWSPNRVRLEAYCADVRTQFGLEALAASSAEEACRTADVIITTTPSREPIVRADWLKTGVHVTAVGSDSPGKRELADECVRRADLLVADRRSQCTAFGECVAAPERVTAELGEIVAGSKRGRTNDDQITIADLTGVGFQDTAIASATLQQLQLHR